MTEVNSVDYSHLDEIDKKATGLRIKRLCKNQGISQAQLAILLDREAKTISNYYCGETLPRIGELAVLSRVLGMTIDDLLVFRGDLEGYQRVQQYNIEYDEYTETISKGIERSRIDSKLFANYSKGFSNIWNFKEAGHCLEYLSNGMQEDIKRRMIDALFSGEGPNGAYMRQIFETYIWTRLSSEQKDDCRKYFAYLRGDKDFEEDQFRQLLLKFWNEAI